MVCGKDENGVHILRRRSEDGPIEAGIAQPLTEGKPITGEVISMRRRKDLPFLFDVKTEIESCGSGSDTGAGGDRFLSQGVGRDLGPQAPGRPGRQRELIRQP